MIMSQDSVATAVKISGGVGKYKTYFSQQMSDIWRHTFKGRVQFGYPIMAGALRNIDNVSTFVVKSA